MLCDTNKYFIGFPYICNYINLKESEMQRAVREAIETMSKLTCVRWMEKSPEVSKLVGHDDYVGIADDGRYGSRMSHNFLQ